jgi:hypothetical protein
MMDTDQRRPELIVLLALLALGAGIVAVVLTVTSTIVVNVLVRRTRLGCRRPRRLSAADRGDGPRRVWRTPRTGYLATGVVRAPRPAPGSIVRTP